MLSIYLYFCAELTMLPVHLSSASIYASSHFVIRSQIGNIAALYRNEVERASRNNAPALPKRLGYVRRLRNQGITWAELAA